MLKQHVIYFFAVGMTLLMSACGGGAEKVGLPTGNALFTDAPSAVTIAIGAKVTYTVGGGTPTYNVASGNRDVATATLSGTNLQIVGVAGGGATITVTDQAGGTSNIAVTVPAALVEPTPLPTALFTTAAGTITVGSGSSATYQIGGGKAPYSVSSSNTTVAAVTGSGNSFTVAGVSPGAVQVVITDSTGVALNVAATVGSGVATPLFTTSPGAVTVAPGATAAYKVGGGKPGYTLSSSNSSVATVTANGSDFVITGVATGSAQLAVVDTVGTVVSIDITVGNVGTVTPLFITAPASVTIQPGATANYQIGGGKPAYAVSTSNAAVVQVAISGTSFIVTGGQPGTAQVAVSDSNGATLNFALTVGNGGIIATLFSTAPSAVALAVGATESYTIDGGTGPYSVTSSNTAAATVKLTGKSFVISGLSAGTAQVSILDATGSSIATAVTVGATDKPLFTTAPSAITIAPGDSATFTLVGGKGPYTASSSNGTVARIVMIGSNYTITGLQNGTAQALLLDSNGSAINLAITVGTGTGSGPIALFTTAPDALTLSAGNNVSFTVGGGTSVYSATSSNTSVVTAGLTGTSLTLNAASAGAAVINLTDSSGASVKIDVTVTQTAPTAITLLPGSATGNVGDTLTFIVRGGTPGYSMVINNTAIAVASTAMIGASGDSFTISLRNVGSTTATITDARGQIYTLPIVAEQTITTLRLSPSALLEGENEILPIVLNIYGGTPPYRAFTSDQTLTSVSTSGSTLIISLGTNGNRCIPSINADGTYTPFGTFDVTITTLDSQGASATSVLTIKDNGKGLGVGCP